MKKKGRDDKRKRRKKTERKADNRKSTMKGRKEVKERRAGER